MLFFYYSFYICLTCALLTLDRNTIKPRSNGGANAIDFYSGLKLDGPLNKDMKTYVQVEKE